jgi:hypothetical protein
MKNPATTNILLLEHFFNFYRVPKRSLNQAWAFSCVICGSNSEMA